MKPIFNQINAHPFINKKILSAFLSVLTILLSACGGETSESSTTVKVAEPKVIAKKEEVKVETNKVEPKEKAKVEIKEEVIEEPVVAKVEVEEIKEAPIPIPAPVKLPYSKADLQAVLAKIEIPDVKNFIDTSIKEKEELQAKLKDSIEKDIKTKVDEYIKLGTETLPAEVAKIKKTIKDTFEAFLKDKDDKWESKPTAYGALNKKSLQSGLVDIFKYLGGGEIQDASYLKSCLEAVGLKNSLVADCEDIKQKIIRIEKEMPRAKHYDTFLAGFQNLDEESTVVSNNTSEYLVLFYICGGSKDIAIELEKEHGILLNKYQKSKFIMESKKKLLYELSIVKKDLESEIENDSLGQSRHSEVLTILADKNRIFLSSSDKGKPVLKNILNNKGKDYENCEKVIVDGFRKQVDIELMNKFNSLFELEAKNEVEREKERQELKKYNQAVAERDARIELAKEKARLKAVQAEEERQRIIAEKKAKIEQAKSDAEFVIVKAKAEKIKSSKKYSELDSYEMAFLAFPPTLDMASLAQTSDLSTLKGKITELAPLQCLQSLGSGKALMKCSYFNTPILLEALNPTFANTVYVDKRQYVILVLFVGTTSYKNLLGAEAQAVKAQVIYVRP